MRHALLSLALLTPMARALDVPYLSGRVNDHAEFLSASAREKVEGTLKDFESRTGHQIALLTLPSLEGEALEDFSLKVARTWALGRKGENDGVLILISRDDRKLRIEVGHGLEGTLPDIICGRIIQGIIVPRFREKDFEGGVVAGVDAVVGALEGQAPPDPVADIRRERGGERDDFALMSGMERVLISFFVFGILGLFEFVGMMVPAGGGGWFLYFFLIPFWAAFPMAIWGARIGMGCLLSHLIGFPILKMILPKTEWAKRASKGIRVSSGGGGWSSGSSGFSSGSSGGGFSGGGGSFGGGGSSGSW
ncbi:MAG: TPM domain-containing protein [Elusimicrobia bacterium]|nr:TPM domain-containing protein [Elusimicrobiota bacterium]